MTQGQLTLMHDIVSKMKKDKDKAMKQVKEMEAALEGLILKIRVRNKDKLHFFSQKYR